MQDCPLWQLGNQWHLQKKWNSFLDPRALRQNLHFQTSEYRYVNISRGILGGTFRALLGTLFGALLGALWGALWMALWGHYGRHFGGTLEGTFGGTFGDDLGPQALHQNLYFQSKCQILGHFGGHFFKANFWGNLETNDIYKKSGTVFWTPQVLPQSLHFQSSANRYVKIFGGTFRGAFVGTMGGTLGDNLGIQALHQSVFPIRMSNSRALFGGTFSRQIFEAIFGTIFQVYWVTILVTIFQ